MYPAARIVQTHTDTYKYQVRFFDLTWLPIYQTSQTFTGSQTADDYIPQTNLEKYKGYVDWMILEETTKLAKKKAHEATKIKNKVIYP